MIGALDLARSTVVPSIFTAVVSWEVNLLEYGRTAVPYLEYAF